MMNEFELIQNYFSWEHNEPSIELGVGDDAALFNLPPGHQLATSTDTLVEGIHFFKDASPSDIAYKSLAVNLSDIAAMGATAKCFTLSLTIPKLDHEWLEKFSSSLKESSRLFNVHLVGGDTTKGPLNITITMMGSIEIDSAPSTGYVLTLFQFTIFIPLRFFRKIIRNGKITIYSVIK